MISTFMLVINMSNKIAPLWLRGTLSFLSSTVLIASAVKTGLNLLASS